jgi:hypothetical protein
MIKIFRDMAARVRNVGIVKGSVNQVPAAPQGSADDKLRTAICEILNRVGAPTPTYNSSAELWMLRTMRKDIYRIASEALKR